MARIGKIARCPEPIRVEVCRRLNQGQLGPQILPWLNSQPEVQAMLKEFFGGAPVNAQNLSDWRAGGFHDWLDHQSRSHHVRELADRAIEFTRANSGRIAEGAAAIVSGKLLELMESVDGAMDLDQLGDVVNNLASLRSGEIAQQRADTDREKLKRKDEELRLERIRLDVILNKASERMLSDLVRKQAEQIANSNLSNAEKIAALRKVAFADVDALEASGMVVLPS